MMMGRAFMYRMVDNYMPVGHACDCRHLVAHKHNGSITGQLSDYIIELMLKPFVDITQRLIKYKQLGS